MSELSESKPQEKVELLIGVGRYREALAELGPMLGGEYVDYDTLCQKAVCHFHLKEFQAAFDATRAAIAAEPESEWAYRLRSLVFTANGEYKRALEAAETALEKAPYSFDNHQILFFAQANYGSLDKARHTLATLLELDPNSVAAHLAAGYLALKEEHLTGAERSFLEALKLDPESVDALNNLGVVYLEMANAGRGEKYRQLSVEMFERSVRSEPTFTQGQVNIKAASEKPVKYRRSAAGFVIFLFLASSPLQVVLYNGFSAQITVRTSMADLFSPLIGDVAIIALNIATIALVIGFGAVAAAYSFVDDKSRVLSIVRTRGFWYAALAGRIWLISLIVSVANLSTLRQTHTEPG